MPDEEWYVDERYPIRMEPDGYTVKLIWDSPISGQFELKYGDVETKTIVVQSLF